MGTMHGGIVSTLVDTAMGCAVSSTLAADAGFTTLELSTNFVRAITQIAQSLGQKTVAEGVEDEATLGLLRGVGVDFVQGYHLGRPAPFAVAA